MNLGGRQRQPLARDADIATHFLASLAARAEVKQDRDEGNLPLVVVMTMYDRGILPRTVPQQPFRLDSCYSDVPLSPVP